MTDYLAKARGGHDHFARGGGRSITQAEITAAIALAEERRRTADALETKQDAAEPDRTHLGLVFLWVVVTVCQLLLVAVLINDIS